MSLKAKLEAVIYAAEEPVTLAQLAVIFADEVPPEPAEPTVEPETATEQNAAPETETVPEAAAEAEPAAEPVAEAASEPAAEPETAGAETAGQEATEEDPKKAARQRDRRIRQVLQVQLDELIADYANSDRGMEVREIAGGYRMATKPEYHDAVRGFVKSLKPPMKLSLQALETLAVIAYKQPVTAPEVSEIRGVDSGGVLGSLVSRKLITTAGRKQVIGRPILYKTTKEFLLRFGLKDVNDLPSMEEFEKMAGELVEPEAAEGEPEAVQVEAQESAEAEAGAEPTTEAANGPESEALLKSESEASPAAESAPEVEAAPAAEPEDAHKSEA